MPAALHAGRPGPGAPVGTALDERPAPHDAPAGGPELSPPSLLRVPTGTLGLLGLLLAAGSAILVFAYLTVHGRDPSQLTVHFGAARTHLAITHWLEHGYFRSGGLSVRNGETGLYFYRSSTGGRLLTGFLLEKVYSAVAGRYSWRLLALHNQVFSLGTAALLGLLGFRVARRLGARPLHALVLAVSLEAVHFTFPDNLALFWEMSARGCWLFFAALFLLIEERCVDGRTRGLTIAQAVATFLLTYMDHIAGPAFVASYCAVTLLLGNGRRTLKRVVVTAVAPAALALAVFAVQLGWVHVAYPDIPKQGSGFLARTGLDGSSQHYVDHMDIAYGRDLARANFAQNRSALFRWQWLFVAGTTAFLGSVVAAMRGRVPRVVVVSLVSLLGAYLLYAAVFSQAVVIHPYLYDVMLFTPLVLALFVVVPCLVESVAAQRGLAVVAVFFLAVWVSMVQMRDYALRFPLAP